METDPLLVACVAVIALSATGSIVLTAWMLIRFYRDFF
jgi:hypothetical protein